MRHQEATTLIGAPVDEVEKALAVVESWPTFLADLESVEKLGHERYRFRIVDGRDRRESTVCVRHWMGSHLFTWRALDGPPYTGRLELGEVDPDHTTARLSLTRHPGTFAAGLAEMVLPRMGRAARDLRKLEEHLLSPR